MGLPRERELSNSLVSPKILGGGGEGGVEYVTPQATEGLRRISRGIHESPICVPLTPFLKVPFSSGGLA